MSNIYATFYESDLILKNGVNHFSIFMEVIVNQEFFQFRLKMAEELPGSRMIMLAFTHYATRLELPYHDFGFTLTPYSFYKLFFTVSNIDNADEYSMCVYGDRLRHTTDPDESFVH